MLKNTEEQDGWRTIRMDLIKDGVSWRGALPRETGNAQFPHDEKKAGTPSTQGVQRGVQRGFELE